MSNYRAIFKSGYFGSPGGKPLSSAQKQNGGREIITVHDKRNGWRKVFVELRGVEPLTFSLRTRRSTN